MRGSRPPSGGREIGKKGGVVRTRRTHFWTISAEGNPPRLVQPHRGPPPQRAATSADLMGLVA
eukprot:298133-Chlamydomonas_euryale.AAC.1